MIHKTINKTMLLVIFLVGILASCTKELEQPELNNNFAGGTDFSKTEDMIFSLIGVYQAVTARGWEQPLVVATRGDDVNAAGDQQGLINQDRYVYDNSFFGSRTLWETYYGDIIRAHTGMEQIERYQEFADADGIALGNQYIAEAKVSGQYCFFSYLKFTGLYSFLNLLILMLLPM